MDTNYLENNYLTLVGKVTGEKKFSHEIYGERFYTFNLSIPRLSGNSDIIPITTSERLIKEDTLEEGRKLFEVMDLGRRIYSDDFRKFDNDGYIFVSDPEKLKR